MRFGLFLAVFLTFGTFIMACSTTPETGRQQLNLVSDDQMNQMGEEAYKQLLSESKISKNRELNEQVQAIGRRIAKASGIDYNWEFTVIDDPKTVNAFCLPGGKVGVYTGLIPIAENTAGLAAVIGHEVAHAVLRHSSERMSQEMVTQFGLAVASMSFGDSKYRDLIAGAMGIGAVYGITLPFSRYHEAEADQVGLEYMAKAGYDPQEAIALWYRMGEEGGSRPPEFLSTHPDPVKRAKDLQKKLPEALALYRTSPYKSGTQKFAVGH